MLLRQQMYVTVSTTWRTPNAKNGEISSNFEVMIACSNSLSKEACREATAGEPQEWTQESRSGFRLGSRCKTAIIVYLQASLLAILLPT